MGVEILNQYENKRTIKWSPLIYATWLALVLALTGCKHSTPPLSKEKISEKIILNYTWFNVETRWWEDIKKVTVKKWYTLITESIWHFLFNNSSICFSVDEVKKERYCIHWWWDETTKAIIKQE